MKSLPDLILKKLDAIEPGDNRQNSDGEFWYNSNPDNDDDSESTSEVDRLHQNREERIRQQFSEVFYPRSLRYLGIVILVLLFLSLFQYAVINRIEAQTLGISITIIGSIVLGISLLRGPREVMRRTSVRAPTLDGSNKDPETIGYVRTTIDGINGIFYIILGFVIQIVAIMWG